MLTIPPYVCPPYSAVKKTLTAVNLDTADTVKSKVTC